MTDQEARTILERIIDERAQATVHVTVHLAIEKWATELAKEAMEDPEFRREWRDQVREATAAHLAALRGKSDPKVIQTPNGSDQGKKGGSRKRKGRK